MSGVEGATSAMSPPASSAMLPSCIAAEDETAQLDGQIRPTTLNHAVEIYESKALEVRGWWPRG
jgi:hypothetical protein